MGVSDLLWPREVDGEAATMATSRYVKILIIGESKGAIIAVANVHKTSEGTETSTDSAKVLKIGLVDVREKW